MNISRRTLLRGHLRSKPPSLRPPWALAEHEFIHTCTRCGNCAAACPGKIIVTGDGGFPEINFAAGECTFCRKCVEACQPMALHAGAKTRAWAYRAAISDSCLAKQGVVCQTCAEACETQAIRFSPQLRSAALPIIALDACNSCGACVAPCPAQAISVNVE